MSDRCQAAILPAIRAHQEAIVRFSKMTRGVKVGWVRIKWAGWVEVPYELGVRGATDGKYGKYMWTLLSLAELIELRDEITKYLDRTSPIFDADGFVDETAHYKDAGWG